MHIYDFLNNRNIDYYKESIKLLTIFNEKDYFFQGAFIQHTLFDVVTYFFRDLPLSQNFINYEEYIKKEDFISVNSIESFCFLSEKVLTLLSQLDILCKNSTSVNSDACYQKIKNIVKVIRHDLEETGFSTKIHKDNKYGFLIVIYPKDEHIFKAVEANANIADAIIDYSRPSNKGNLLEKEKNLHFIIKSVEHIAQDETFKYPKIAEQAQFIFNMFHIRHDNIQGKYQNCILPTLTDEELEKIFDMGYRLSLELLILDEFQNIDPEIDLLRKKMKQGKQL